MIFLIRICERKSFFRFLEIGLIVLQFMIVRIRRTVTVEASTGGQRLMTNWLKESSAALPIKMFGGSPTSVSAPPMLDSMISPMM